MKLSGTKTTDWVRYSFVAIAILYAFFAGLRTVADFDLGWQIATGRYILQHHSIPSIEVFSYTAHGNPWIYPPFSGVIFSALFLAGGFAAALAIIAVPPIAFRTVPRAELFTTVLFAAFASLLWSHYEGERERLWL